MWAPLRSALFAEEVYPSAIRTANQHMQSSRTSDITHIVPTSPGFDEIPAELIKAGVGKILISVWVKEE